MIEAVDRVLPSFHPELSAKALQSLANLGVNVLTSTRLTNVEPHSITIEQAGTSRQIELRTILWAAGVQASPLGKKLAEAAGIAADRAGRVPVQGDLTIAGHPEVLVIGDMAALNDYNGQPLPALAPVAMQQGGYAAKLVHERLAGRKPAPFYYRDRGVMATIGRCAQSRICDLSGSPGRLHGSRGFSSIC